MFGSSILDVAVGLVFVYLLLSLLVTAGSELIASCLNWRAHTLRQAIRRFLDPSLAEKLYDHPLIKKLSRRSRGPSYIPSATFALALVDVIADLSPGESRGTRTFASMIGVLPDPDVRRVLSLLAAEAGQDGQKLKENIESWFDSSMDRVVGWYKRKMQAVNAVLALVFAVAVNADSVLIVRHLSNDSALRAALVAQAQELVKERPAAPSPPGAATMGAPDELETRIGRLSGLGIPIGWSDESLDASRQWPGWRPDKGGAAAWAALWLRVIRSHLLGWLLTALAASLGAPFWFDVLDKIIAVRSAGPVPESRSKPAGGAAVP
jgi:hypothetical protein